MNHFYVCTRALAFVCARSVACAADEWLGSGDYEFLVGAAADDVRLKLPMQTAVR